MDRSQNTAARRLKGLIVVTAAALLAIILLFVGAYYHARGALVDSSRQRLADVRALSHKRVVAHFERARLVLERVAQQRTWKDRAALRRLAGKHGLARLMVVHQEKGVDWSSDPGPERFPQGTLLNEGPAARTALAECVRKAHRSPRTRVFFADHEATPSGEVMSFLCISISDRFTEDVLVAELDLARLQAVASLRQGVIRGGQVFLVGGDLRLRTDFHFQQKSLNVRSSFAGKLRIRRTSVRQAMRGKSGALLELNEARQQVLAAHAPLRLIDSHWAVIAEMPRAAALGQLAPLRWYVRIAALLAMLLLACFIYEGVFGVAFSGLRPAPPAAEEGTAEEGSPGGEARRGARLAGPALAVLATLIAASTILLPMRILEPDDKAFKDTMLLFSSGALVRPLDGTLPQGWAEVPGRKWLMSEKPPGHPLALAALHKLGLERLVNPLWVAACVLALVMLGGALNPGPRFRWLVVILFVSNPTLLLMTYRTYMSDLPGAAAVTCFAALFLAAELKGRRRHYLLAGLFLGLSVVIRYNNLIACLVLPLYFMAMGLLRERSACGLYTWLRGAPAWLVAAGAALPMAGQLCYNWWTTGSPVKVGYSFTMFLSEHPRFGERFFLHNLLDVPPLLLLGFPCLVLLPLGAVKLFQRQRRIAVFCLLLVTTFFVFYLASYWVRADHFIFTSRYYLPALFGMTICAAEAILAFRSRRAAALTVCLLILLSASLAGDFVKRYVLSDTWYIRAGQIESHHTLDDLQDP